MFADAHDRIPFDPKVQALAVCHSLKLIGNLIKDGPQQAAR
jgi:hypothetical protein